MTSSRFTAQQLASRPTFPSLAATGFFDKRAAAEKELSSFDSQFSMMRNIVFGIFALAATIIVGVYITAIIVLTILLSTPWFIVGGIVFATACFFAVRAGVRFAKARF